MTSGSASQSTDDALCVPVHNAASLLDASKCFTRLLLNSATHGKDARLFTGQEGKERETGAPHVVVLP